MAEPPAPPIADRKLKDDCFLHDKDRLRHADALALIRNRVSPVAEVTEMPLESAAGTILAEDIVSARTVPSRDNAAVDGYANDWHFAHLARFALGGAGIVFAEATGVSADARRTHGDLGLWEDGQIEPLRRVTEFIRAQGSVPAIQLGHAGRKASERRPWHGETPVDDEDVQLRREAQNQVLQLGH